MPLYYTQDILLFYFISFFILFYCLTFILYGLFIKWDLELAFCILLLFITNPTNQHQVTAIGSVPTPKKYRITAGTHLKPNLMHYLRSIVNMWHYFPLYLCWKMAQPLSCVQNTKYEVQKSKYTVERTALMHC